MKAENDAQLQYDVLTELEWEPSIDAATIGVTAKNGVVTLTGAVPSYYNKLTAERVAKRIFGVKAVANDIAVHLPGSAERTDTDIASAAVNALHWDTTVPSDDIQVLVEGGKVALEGAVDWHYQKEAAERAIRTLVGVKEIINRITVKGRVQPTDVQEKIEAAFKRSAELDARRISVEAQDGKVILRGNVRSWNESNEAQQAAWSAPGVTAVENDITVVP